MIWSQSTTPSQTGRKKGKKWKHEEVWSRETGKKRWKKDKTRRKNTIRRGRVWRTVALENFQIINLYNKAIISNNTNYKYIFLGACLSLAHYNKQIIIPSIWMRKSCLLIRIKFKRSVLKYTYFMLHNKLPCGFINIMKYLWNYNIALCMMYF